MAHPSSADQLIEWLSPQAGERVLDLGCGLGLLTRRLAQCGAEVTGLEILPHLEEQFRLAAPGCLFVAGDLLEWQSARPFDALFAHASLNWIRPPDKAARRMAALLRPGGRLACFLGGASQVARELETYYDPLPRDYEKVLRKAGLAVERWEEAHGGFLIFAHRR